MPAILEVVGDLPDTYRPGRWILKRSGLPLDRIDPDGRE
jgi:hypothetical protein